jgi:hypothetical protein
MSIERRDGEGCLNIPRGELSRVHGDTNGRRGGQGWGTEGAWAGRVRGLKRVEGGAIGPENGKGKRIRGSLDCGLVGKVEAQ